MCIPANVIANADDLGMRPSVNKAILYCFEQGYINSTSIMVNTGYFEEAVDFVHDHSSITNIGVHVNLAAGKPISNFYQPAYLTDDGNWNFTKINIKLSVLSAADKAAFSNEIHAQIDKALANKIPLTHIDSHRHIHNLPCFYKLFLEAAKHYNLKIRLAQTYNEGNYLNFYYRKYINNAFRKGENNYSDYFEDVQHFLKNGMRAGENSVVEIMLHPDFDATDKLIDHFDKNSLKNWIAFLEDLKIKDLVIKR
jgi:predicted glycoside hydrolase/deacetylase ChbG (UPF0249 family)